MAETRVASSVNEDITALSSSSHKVLVPSRPSLKFESSVAAAFSFLQTAYQLWEFNQCNGLAGTFAINEDGYEELRKQLQDNASLEDWVYHVVNVCFDADTNELDLVMASSGHNATEKIATNAHNEGIQNVQIHGSPAAINFAKDIESKGTSAMSLKDYKTGKVSRFCNDMVWQYQDCVHGVQKEFCLSQPLWKAEDKLARSFARAEGQCRLAIAYDFPYSLKDGQQVDVVYYRPKRTWVRYRKSGDRNDLWEAKRITLRDSRGHYNESAPYISWRLEDYAPKEAIKRAGLTPADRAIEFRIDAQVMCENFDRWRAQDLKYNRTGLPILHTVSEERDIRAQQLEIEDREQSRAEESRAKRAKHQRPALAEGSQRHSRRLTEEEVEYNMDENAGKALRKDKGKSRPKKKKGFLRQLFSFASR